MEIRLVMRRLAGLIMIILLLLGVGRQATPTASGQVQPRGHHACRRFLPKGTSLPPPRRDFAGALDRAIHTLILDESSAQLAAQAGFQTVVQLFPWRDLEPADDTFEWAVSDAMVDLALRFDLEMVVRLDMPPEWANRPVSSGLPFDLPAYTDYVGHVARRYQGRIKAYIIWNEPNLAAEWSRSGGVLNDHFARFDGWVAQPADYAGVVGAAYRAIRSADSRALVVAGGLAPTNEFSARAVDDRAYLQRLYDVDWQHCFDILAVHDYGFGLPAAAPNNANDGLNLGRIESLRATMLANGDVRPVWITELGYTIHSSSHPPVSKQQQADYLLGAYRRTREEWPWVELFTVWNLTTGRPPEDEMSGYSIVEPDGSPRPAFTVFAGLDDGHN